MSFVDYIKSQLAGETTTDEVVRQVVIREVIYKQADLLSVGTKIIPVKDFEGLDIKFSYPALLTAEYPVPEGGSAEIRSVDFVDFTMSLEKAEVKFGITHEAQLRQIDNYQVDFSKRRAAEALAASKDTEILTKLMNGAGNTVAAVDTWDGANADPATDVAKAIGAILDNSTMMATDIKQISVVVPTSKWAYISKPLQINAMKTTVSDWLKSTFGLQILPSRRISDVSANTALVVVNSPMTAVHGVLRTNKIPLAEAHPMDWGTMWIVRQYFKTTVVPDSSSVSTSSWIAKITGL